VTTQLLLVVLVLIAVLGAGVSAEPTSEKVYTKESVLGVMRRVRGYQLAHPWKKTDRNWIRATYYTGLMGLYRATKDPEVLAQAVHWAQKHKWAEGNESERANRKTCGQTYLELYFLDPEPERIAKIRAYVDSRIAKIRAGEKPTKAWYYCDTLYVGPPTLAMLGTATGERKYYDYLNEVYWAVTDHLLDKKHKLFYRDKRYFDAKTKRGRKVFWSRGNGWVIGGLPRVLQYLPGDNPRCGDYAGLLKTLAASIAKCQQFDGLWRSNLADPEQHPNPETSGTAFFCYAMGWGVNQKILDRDTYLPVVLRAWGGLARHTDKQGRLGYVQPVGGDPRPATAEMTHEYAMGLLLLAGEEMIKLVESGTVSKDLLHKHEQECRRLRRHDPWLGKTR